MHRETQEYREELAEHSRRFAGVNTTNDAALRRWLEDTAYLGTGVQSQIASVSPWTIRSWKRRLGIKVHRPKDIIQYKGKRRIDTVVVPPTFEEWNNKEWLAEQLKYHSMRSIARAVGRDISTIAHKVRRWNIPHKTAREATASTHPCCTYEWCYKHYVELGLSQLKCAKLAGVCEYTVSCWLARFKIPLRTTSGSAIQRNSPKLWRRRLVASLKKQPIVVGLRFPNPSTILVKHRSHLHSRYWLETPIDRPRSKSKSRDFAITKSTSYLGRVPKVVYQFECGLGDNPFPAHVVIQEDTWAKATTIGRELAIHDLIWQLRTRGWIWPKYPEYVIQAELDQLRGFRKAKYIVGTNFTAFPRHLRATGKRMVEHFFDPSEFMQTINIPHRLYWAIENLAKQGYRIDTHNILRSISYRFGPRLYNPTTYAAILTKLGAKSVLDLHPGYGNRAIACALAGIRYYARPHDGLQKALGNGLAEFVGLDHHWYAGEKVDLVLADNNYSYTNVEEALTFAGAAKAIMVFVPRKNRAEVQHAYRPRSLIKIKARWHRRDPDYLAIW